MFPQDSELRLAPEEVTAIYLRALSPDPDTRAGQCERLRQFLAARAPHADFDALLARHGATAAPTGVIINGGRPGITGSWEVVDTAAHGVTDVHAASLLAARLLGYQAGQIRYDLPEEKLGLINRLQRSFSKRARWLVGQATHAERR